MEENLKSLKELNENGKPKPKFSLIPQLALKEVAEVFSYGANKYEKYNFSNGQDATVYTDAALRHIHKYLLNYDVDDESKLYHLAHACSNLMMLLDNDINNTTVDDRNKKY